MACYILDTNFFVQAHRQYYPFDVFPSFWDTIHRLCSDGVLVSIDKVYNELRHNNDALTKWVDDYLTKEFFVSTETIIPHYTEVIKWATSKSSHYKPAALSEFLHADEADAWLVAYALADRDNRNLITHEVSRPEARNKIKIPEACNAVNVGFMDSITMFRAIGVRI